MSTYRPILQMQGALVNLCRALLQVYTALLDVCGAFERQLLAPMRPLSFEHTCTHMSFKCVCRLEALMGVCSA